MLSALRGRGQLAAAVAILLFGLFMFWQATLLKIGTPSAPGPSFFTLGLSAVLAVLGAGLAFEARSAVASETPGADRPREGYLKITLVLGLLLVQALVFEPLGYLPSAALITCTLLRLAGRGWVSTLVIGLAATVVSHLLFSTALGVPLPRGILDGLL